MSMQPSKPQSGSFVPDIPRRGAADLPGSPARRPAPRSNIESQRLLVGTAISLSGELLACDILVVERTVESSLEQSQLTVVTDTGTFRRKVHIENEVSAATPP